MSVRFVNRDDAYNDATAGFPGIQRMASRDSSPASFIVKLKGSRAAPRLRSGDEHPAGWSRCQREGSDRPAVRRSRRAHPTPRSRWRWVQAIGAVLLIANMVWWRPYTRAPRSASCGWWAPAAGTPSCRSCFRGRGGRDHRRDLAIIGLIVVRAMFLDRALTSSIKPIDRQDRLRRHPATSHRSAGVGVVMAASHRIP